MIAKVISSKLAISLMFAVVIVATMPAFAIFGFYKSVIVMTPVVWTLITTLMYSLKSTKAKLKRILKKYPFQFIVYTSILLVAILVYADIAFPWVMRKFGEIFLWVDMED
uniref:Serpentine receptor class gamma n=1 Tax=Panagrellus redivivus TaxID=6233 RepID=A0A7E4V2P0_PANRE